MRKAQTLARSEHVGASFAEKDGAERAHAVLPTKPTVRLMERRQ